jgi:hypothetical protein
LGIIHSFLRHYRPALCHPGCLGRIPLFFSNKVPMRLTIKAEITTTAMRAQLRERPINFGF